MDYAFSPEDEAFRAEVRAFLKEALPSDWAVRRAGDDDGDDDSSQEFQEHFHKRLAEKGWLVVSWPKEYGGQEWSYLRQFVFSAESACHQAPTPRGNPTPLARRPGYRLPLLQLASPGRRHAASKPQG